MRALNLILIVFASFMVFLGYMAKDSANNPLGNALIFGGFALYLGVFLVWVLFKLNETGDKR